METNHYECAVCKHTFISDKKVTECPECENETLLVDEVEVDDVNVNAGIFKCGSCSLEYGTNEDFKFCPQCGSAVFDKVDFLISRSPIDKLKAAYQRRTLVIDIGGNLIFVGLIVLLIFLIIKG